MSSENVGNKIHDGIFLNCDGHRLYFKENESTVVLPVNKFHTPYCLVICDDNLNPGKYRDTTHAVISKIEEKIQEMKEDYEEGKNSPYRYVMVDGDGNIKKPNPRVWRSFHNPNLRYRCVEMHTTKSYKVPELSTQLFKDFGYATAEFDIPYRDRAMIDLQAEQRLWLLDTGGEACELKVLAYDIETTEYDPTEVQDNGQSPIDMIGWASFTISYKAKRDPNTGKCAFEMLSMPEWEEPEIKQVVGHNLDEEIAHLIMFIDLVLDHDIICGHNIMQFDNTQIHNRLQFLRGYRWDEKRWVPEEGAKNRIPEQYQKKVKFFLEKRNRGENIFFYGDMQRCVDFFPLSFDTYFASKRLFFFLSEYNLKALAKTFGYIIEDRVYLDPISQSIETPEQEKKTLKYNEHDVREQIGVTLHLLPDAIRLCHLTGMAFNDCMPAGTTKIWDTMTFIRSHQTKRIMPAIASAQVVSRELFHRFGTVNPKTKKPYTKPELAELARRSLTMPEPVGQRTLKVLKYGIEAPDYIMYPQLIYNPYSAVMLHVITAKDCGCKECRNFADIRHCDCDYCQGLRKQFPEGLKEKDNQVEFIMKELKKAGHPEDDEALMRAVTAERGFRKVAQGYHFPGGLTIHPAEVNSEFKMWWGIKVCDVGAMYPSNLKAENIGGDTVRFADPRFFELKGDKIQPKAKSPFKYANEVYRWVWLKRLRYDVVKNFFIAVTADDLQNKSEYKQLKKDYPFVTYGYLVGIVIDHEEGGIGTGMGAVLDVTDWIKKRKGEISRPDSGASDRTKTQIANAYQSMKSMRNSGTHGILTAPTVSCRQFNLGGGARITTLGQQILDDAMDMLRQIDARFVYGDSVTGDRPVWLRKDGFVYCMPVEEAFDWLMAGNNSVFRVDPDTGHEYVYVKGVDTLTFDDDSSVIWQPVQYVTRHTYAGEIVRIRTAQGDTTVTTQHSVFGVRDNKISEVTAGDLDIGDNIVVGNYNNISLPGRDITINLLKPKVDGWKRLGLVVNIPYVKGKNDVLLEHYYYGHRATDGIVKDRIRKCVSEQKVDIIRLSLVKARQFYKNGIIDNDDLKCGSLSSNNGKGKIPLLIPLDEGFATILGFFLTEGSSILRCRHGTYCTDVVLINNQNRGWCEDVMRHVFNIFGKKVALNIADKRRQVVYRVSYNNKSIYYLLIHVLGCGKNARTKRVPMEILNARLAAKRAFFDAMMNGDGSYAKDLRYLETPESFSSQSYQMQAVVTTLGTHFFDKIPYIKYRKSNDSYTTVFVRSRKYGYKKNGLWVLPVGYVDKRRHDRDMVYDISVGNGTPRFFDGLGMTALHNTDGIYLATSKNASAVTDERQTDRHPFREMYDLPDADHFMEPDLIDQTIAHINKKWQDILDYPTYELEVENEDGMLFVKHKNYLKFHHKFTDEGGCKLVFKTKGNNFKAKDKAKIATDALEFIMREMVVDHMSWEDEEEECQEVRSDIRNKARTVVEGLNPDEMGLGKFLIRQVIQPVGAYKQSDKACTKCEGAKGGCEYCAGTGLTLNPYAQRSNAMERVVGKAFKSAVVAQCVVCENPLPLLEGKKKSGSKPIAYMWPVDLLENPDIKEKSGGIDFHWYKDTVFNYIKGAFGFDDWNLEPWVCIMKQMRLDGACTVKIVAGKNYAKKGKKASGKMIDCTREIFDKLKANQPVEDDIMDELTSLHPDMIEEAIRDVWGKPGDD